MEYDESFESWLHDIEMKVDPCSLFPEFCREKMSSSSSSSLDAEITANQKETDQKLCHETETSSITPISFSEASLSFSYLDANLQVDDAEKILPARKKTTLPLPQHIVVERKRRRELNQRFLALSKVVPGNKKKDRASILGEAVKYMTDLQERIKKLEEKNKKKVVESVLFVKNPSSSSSSSISSSSSDQLYYDRSHNQNNNNDEEGDYYYYYCNPSYEEAKANINKRSVLMREEEIIEVKVIERSVLVRVHCGNNHHNANILPTLLSSISELHLTVLTANTLPFGNHVDITVIAQMGVNSHVKTKDIVDHLRLALPNFI